jgi:hypothetical protein
MVSITLSIRWCRPPPLLSTDATTLACT